MKRKWILNGKHVDINEIINIAKEHGYINSHNVFFTSEACRYLERAGYKIECIEE